LEISLKVGKKWVKKCAEREIIFNVHKFMKNESEVGIKIPVSKVQRRDMAATRVSRRTLCRALKEGVNVETGVAMAFSTPRKRRPRVCTKSI
jgi:hypothetical protein